MKTLLVANAVDFERTIRYLKGCSEIALDLEFDNNRYTYGLNLCLIQVADRAQCFLIDPFAVHNLQPLWALLEDPAITKIFHSSTSDILLLKAIGCAPRNLMDTEVAVRLLNYPKTSLAYVLLQNLGVDLDKSLQVSNWNTRPLTREQLLYAQADVEYLHELKDRLVAELQQIGRLHWFEEECFQLELIENRENLEPHLKLKESNRLTYFQQFILKQMFDFRDKLGQKFNKPSAFIIPNEVLVSLASRPAISFEEWMSLKGLYRTIKDRAFYQRFIQSVQEAEQEATAQNIPHRLPTPPRRPVPTIPEVEVERRKQLGARLRKALADKYGEIAAAMVLGQSAVSDYCNGGNLVIRKHYAAEAILETASEIGIKPAELQLEAAMPSGYDA